MKCLTLLGGMVLFSSVCFAAVDLLGFTAHPGFNRIGLWWLTASETNNDHFEIMRDETLVATVQGAGNSSSPMFYSWTDSTVALADSHAYRLTSVDVSGHRDSLGTVTSYCYGVALLNFSAAWLDTVIQLSWSTSAEVNTDHFEILRDNLAVAQITAAGNSNVQHDYAWADLGLVPGSYHVYRLLAVDLNGDREDLDTAVVGAEPVPFAGRAQPESFSLLAYPNPFNSTTQFAFVLPQSAEVRLTVYDLTGREVQTIFADWLPSGEHRLSFDASHLASGTYVAALRSDKRTALAKLILLK